MQQRRWAIIITDNQTAGGDAVAAVYALVCEMRSVFPPIQQKSDDRFPTTITTRLKTEEPGVRRESIVCCSPCPRRILLQPPMSILQATVQIEPAALVATSTCPSFAAGLESPTADYLDRVGGAGADEVVCGRQGGGWDYYCCCEPQRSEDVDWELHC